jgi:hypothetical protein
MERGHGVTDLWTDSNRKFHPERRLRLPPFRAADLGHGNTAAWWLGMVFVSVLGYGRFYKGPVGIVIRPSPG